MFQKYENAVAVKSWRLGCAEIQNQKSRLKDVFEAASEFYCEMS